MMQQQLWTEKYRPQTLDEVQGHEIEVERFKRFLDPETGGGLPHCILAGPPGVGKTAVAVAWAKDFYGDEWRENLREFNASDKRGIDIVRDRVKGWCRTSTVGDYPYKIIFLDEAERLTEDAQFALRRIMEQYSDTTRFILTCNYVDQILDPLQSRCATFRFGGLKDSEVREVVETILEGEGIESDEKALEKVVRASEGRARDAIITLRQSVKDGKLSEEYVNSVTGVVDRNLVRNIMEEALAGNHDEAMRRFDVELLKEGANPDQLVRVCFEVLKELDMPEDSRVKCFDLLADIDGRIKRGLNPHVQFHALLGHVFMAQGLSAYSQQGVE